MELEGLVESAVIGRLSDIKCKLAELDKMKEKGTLSEDAYAVSMQEVANEVEELERYLVSLGVVNNEQ